MESRWSQVVADDGHAIDVYLSAPPTGRGPGLLLLQEIFGVNRHIRAVADQWAQAGWHVMAPDVFGRVERLIELGYAPEDVQKGRGYRGKLDMARTVADVRDCVDALRALPGVDGSVASIGYCFGGLLSFLAAARAGVDAAVCYYGGGIAQSLDAAAAIRCPILLHFGGKDQMIPAEAIESIRAALAGNPRARVEVYPDADHGFNCWERGSYHQPAAALALGRSLEFLAPR
jgi:carboxymethylenebutenolidase